MVTCFWICKKYRHKFDKKKLIYLITKYIYMRKNTQDIGTINYYFRLKETKNEIYRREYMNHIKEQFHFPKHEWP